MCSASCHARAGVCFSRLSRSPFVSSIRSVLVFRALKLRSFVLAPLLGRVRFRAVERPGLRSGTSFRVMRMAHRQGSPEPPTPPAHTVWTYQSYSARRGADEGWNGRNRDILPAVGEGPWRGNATKRKRHFGPLPETRGDSSSPVQSVLGLCTVVGGIPEDSNIRDHQDERESSHSVCRATSCGWAPWGDFFATQREQIGELARKMCRRPSRLSLFKEHEELTLHSVRIRMVLYRTLPNRTPSHFTITICTSLPHGPLKPNLLDKSNAVGEF